jgi:hypothetical protein
MSTYSNRDIATTKTLSCSSPDTLWAWCYGSPSVVDPKNPDKASCSCPVKQTATTTLGGDSLQAACSGLWSAATLAADAGANAIFAAYMKKNQPQCRVCRRPKPARRPQRPARAECRPCGSVISPPSFLFTTR